MEMEIFVVAKMILTLVVGGIMLLFAGIIDSLLLKPKRLRSKLENQGIRGPSPTFFLGNLAEMKLINQAQKSVINESACDYENFHNWPSDVFPHLQQWRNLYGSVFVYSIGNIQILCITEPGLVKELSLCTSMDLGKPSYLSTDLLPLLGRGVFTSNGSYWAHQRKIIAPEFYLDKVKGMVKMIAECTLTMLDSWERKVEMGKIEFKVDQELRNLSAHVISSICFGGSYAHWEDLFTKLHTLESLVSKSKTSFPRLRYLPNRNNREIRKLESEIESIILDVVKEHTDNSFEKDFLQLILRVDIPVDLSRRKFVIDNCKNICFAGHETIATTASWCLMTMSIHSEWQIRARAEVLAICGKNLPTADMLKSMKTLNMVIQETLRLYPPMAFSSREALKDITLKEISIPKGVNLHIFIPILHRLHDLWGPDAHQFKPERFSKGIAGACKNRHAYIPFGVGTRTCIGQNLAMVELKVILSLILSRFSFSLSSSYRHSPVSGMLILQPEYGVIIQIDDQINRT